MIRDPWSRLAGLGARRTRQLVPIAFCLSVAATGCASGVGTAAPTVPPSPTGAVSSGPTDGPNATAPSLAGSTTGSVPQLLVLADGVQGGVGLWTDTGGSWAARWPLPGATVLGRDGQTLVLAINGALEFRAESSPQTPAKSVSPRRGTTPLDGAVVGVDRSDAGATAIAVSQSGGLTFSMVAADGSAADLMPAPESPFGPSVAWLDGQRLAVLASDALQVSRLAVVDTAKHEIALLTGLGGVRVFALSPDRRMLAATTESAVYVAPIGDWLANRAPSGAISLDPAQVVWDLALNADGTRLAMISGTENANGVVADIHELTYVRTGSNWSKETDSAVPFSQADGQVWLD